MSFDSTFFLFFASELNALERVMAPPIEEASKEPLRVPGLGIVSCDH
jgi:hypothetical protein